MMNGQSSSEVRGRYQPEHPVDLLSSWSIFRRGLGDPTIRLERAEAWLALDTPLGDATLHVTLPDPGAGVCFVAYGPGARWAADQVPQLFGAGDDWSAFDDPAFFSGLPELVQRSRSLHRALVLPRTSRVFVPAAGAVLEQRVTGIEANYAWRWLIRHAGRQAPGPCPASLRLFPTPREILGLKRWDWQAARVDASRATTLRHLAEAASRLEWWGPEELETSKPHARPPGTLEAALLAVPGIGPWTVAETLQRSHGSADHISVGDFHLADFVGQVLTGHRVDDATMLSLLEPYRGHRQRVVRLLQLSGVRKQAFGPRYAPLDHRNR
ncbi:DNA-3-methyladenine glycosylase family protein [Glutamicibacter sp. X7]